jgi:hypothetical protein
MHAGGGGTAEGVGGTQLLAGLLRHTSKSVVYLVFKSRRAAMASNTVDGRVSNSARRRRGGFEAPCIV